MISIGHLALFSVYDLYFKENFNPNSRVQIPFEKGLFKIHLPGQLDRLCRRFNNRRLLENQTILKIENEQNDIQEEIKTVHQCLHCFTIYDQAYGDLLRNITAGTQFSELPENYTCPTCDAGKNEMQEVSFISKIQI